MSAETGGMGAEARTVADAGARAAERAAANEGLRAADGAAGGATVVRAPIPDAVRVATIRAPGEAAVAVAPVRDPGPDEVLVRLEGCGVCGSNVPVWEGRPWFRYPLEPGRPGHEGWGEVVAVGRGVEAVRPGARVALLSDHAFAEYDVAPATSVVPLPAALDGRPFPGEAIGCAMNAFRRSGVAGGHEVAVVGVGFLGALLVQLAVRAGAHVVALSRRPSALDVAWAMGAAHVVPLDDADPAGRARAAIGGGLFDVVIEAAGVQGTLDVAGGLVRERGRLVIAGYHQDGTRQVDLQLWNWRGIDVVNAHERDPAQYVRGIRDAVRAVVEDGLELDPLLTHVFPLERLGDALDAARTRPAGFMKALVST